MNFGSSSYSGLREVESVREKEDAGEGEGRRQWGRSDVGYERAAVVWAEQREAMCLCECEPNPKITQKDKDIHTYREGYGSNIRNHTYLKSN